ADEQNQDGHDDRGDRFRLAVPVRVFLVRRLSRGAQADERRHAAGDVRSRIGRVREKRLAARQPAGQTFHDGQEQVGGDAGPGRPFRPAGPNLVHGATSFNLPSCVRPAFKRTGYQALPASSAAGSRRPAVRLRSAPQSGAAMRSDPQAPTTRPMTMAMLNGRSEALPRIRMPMAGSRVVRSVLTDRPRVCHVLRLTRSTTSCGCLIFAKRRFSRIRSKMTIVSLMAYPMMVSTATMNVTFTSVRRMAKAAMTNSAVMNRAGTTETEKRHPKRKATYSTMRRHASRTATTARFRSSRAMVGSTVFTSRVSVSR